MADIFYRSGQIESWGRGTLKMIENAREGEYAVPVFEDVLGGIQVYFEKKEFDEGANEGANDTALQILEITKKSEGIIKTEISAIIAKSPKTVERYISVLNKAGLIEFRGAPKTGGYFLKK